MDNHREMGLLPCPALYDLLTEERSHPSMISAYSHLSRQISYCLYLNIYLLIYFCCLFDALVTLYTFNNPRQINLGLTGLKMISHVSRSLTAGRRAGLHTSCIEYYSSYKTYNNSFRRNKNTRKQAEFINV
uniref:Uncharacterized protein n=1 Tax=Trypanosoma vivax (strain Y486) TaxID=1055687 RepID=G0U3C6_TRYVY|nr:hypothetical protein, unlikely [Trypanosoma vivax Y486]